MNFDEPIHLKRECEVTQIPAGTKVTLPLGTEVVVTQALGGSYTLITNKGLVRIDDQDADALGLEVTKEVLPDVPDGAEVDEQMVWDRLKTVFDPEIPVNIVDLGLVYSMEIQPHAEGGKKVEVKMTLTAPGCGMGPTIQADAKSKVQSVPGVKEAVVDLVWEPAWNQGMISEVGRMKLGMV